VLINKKGVHLNVPEVNRSEHFDKLFMKLANEVLEYQNLIDLDLFTEASIKRMNDRAYIEELLGYLLSGIKEKKKVVENIYKEDINENEYQELKNSFYSTIDKIAILNEFKLINKTRYKQKNDFYTLFSFINENPEVDVETLIYQYKILLLLDGVDKLYDDGPIVGPTLRQGIVKSGIHLAASCHARGRYLQLASHLTCTPQGEIGIVFTRTKDVGYTDDAYLRGRGDAGSNER
jgi:hypothetical protein